MPFGVSLRGTAQGRREEFSFSVLKNPYFLPLQLMPKPPQSAMPAASAGTGKKPKIGHGRVCTGAFAMQKSLCHGKAGLEWVWGFLVSNM